MDFVILTETKKKGSGMEEKGEYIHLFSGVPKEERAKRGVSVLIKKKFKKNITNFETLNERIIKVNIDILGRRLALIGIYAPNDDMTLEVKDNFYQDLQNVLDDIGDTREIIMLGDFNGRIGCETNDEVVGPFGEETSNDNGKRLIELCKNNDLRITNGFFKHKLIHKFTWIQHSKNLKSIIDFMIVKQRTNMKIMDVRVQRGAYCGSDHYLLRCFVAMPWINTKIKKSEEEVKSEKVEIPQYNIDSLLEESIRGLYQKRLDEKLQEDVFHDSEELYNHIKEAIHQTAFEALGIKHKITHQKNTCWWDEECKLKVEEKKCAYQKWLNSKKVEDREQYKRIRNDVKYLLTKKQAEYWDKKCHEIDMHIGGRRCTEAWKFLKNVRSDKVSSNCNGISMKQWEEYYKHLLIEDRVEFMEEDNIHLEESEGKIKVEIKNIKEAVKSLKNHRSSGPGGIPAELIKNGTEKLFRMIRQLFEECINGQRIPEEWKIGWLTSIFKKGNRQVCENYRGITVTSTFSRLYGRILKSFVENEYKHIEVEEQCGFRAGRSCMDNIFVLKQIIEKRLSVGQETHLLFIDLAKAYDNVPLKLLWTALKHAGLNINIINAIRALYKESVTKIKAGKMTSEGFIVSKGLRQGCCISPTLFKIYIEQTLKKWKNQYRTMGINISGTTIFTLQFADDQVLLAERKNDLQNMTNSIVKEYKAWGLSMNINKTKYVCVGKKETHLVLEDKRIIDNCDSYKYLGIEINEEDKDISEINNRISLGRKAIKRLNGVWWNEKLSRKRKLNVYNVIVKSILLYGAEVWKLNAESKRKLNAVEMDALRRSCRISRLERVRNEKIKELIGIKTNIEQDIQIKQLIWYGHVNRMAETRLPRISMNFHPSDKRRRGRPRRTWRDGIEGLLKEFRISPDDCADRGKWKKILLEIGGRRQLPQNR